MVRWRIFASRSCLIFGGLPGFKRSGSGYIARCPCETHEDKHPSFYMPAGRPYGFCFACGFKQSWWDVLESRGLRGWQVVEELAKMAGVAPPPRSHSGEVEGEAGEVKDDGREREDWWETRRRAVWEPEGADVLDYLRSRGYSDDLIQRMDVGARPVSEAGVPAGLKLPGGPEYRLLVPFRSRGGRLVAVAGRRLDGGEPRYMYPPGMGRALLGQHVLRRDAVPVVVEGLMDAIVLEAAGVQGVVALGGAQASGGQIEVLRQYQRVVLALDADDAGRAGTERLVRALVRSGVKTYVAEWVGGAKDPDELFRTAGASPIREAIENATAGHKWLIRRLAPGPGATDQERDESLEKALDFCEVLARRSPAAAEDAVREMAAVYRLTVEALGEEVQRLARKRAEEEEKKRWQDALLAAQRAVVEGKIEKAREMVRKVEETRPVLLPIPADPEFLLRAAAETKDGLDTPWYGLNRLMRIDRGGMTVVGAATSVGKTTFLLNVFLHALRNSDGTVVYWSGEIAGPLLVARLLGVLVGMSVGDVLRLLRSDGEEMDELEAMQKELATLFGERVYILDRSESTDELCSFVRGLAHEREVAAVFIDYLQMLPPPAREGRYATREQEVTAVAKTLHEIARDFNAAVVTAAQLSRSNHRYAERPSLTDLRESGGIEQYATSVIGLWNASMARGAEVFSSGAVPAAPPSGWYWTPRDKDIPEAEAAMAMAASWGKTLLEVSILKSRWHGNVGKTVPLMLDGASGRITDLPDVPGSCGFCEGSGDVGDVVVSLGSLGATGGSKKRGGR